MTLHRPQTRPQCVRPDWSSRTSPRIYQPVFISLVGVLSRILAQWRLGCTLGVGGGPRRRAPHVRLPLLHFLIGARALFRRIKAELAGSLVPAKMAEPHARAVEHVERARAGAV